MYGIRKISKGVSVAMACALLMAFSTPVLETVKVRSYEEIDSSKQVNDIFFGEDCSSCRYITIYDENDQLVYDELVKDIDNISDAKLKCMLEDSYFLMRNSITDFYILSK